MKFVKINEKQIQELKEKINDRLEEAFFKLVLLELLGELDGE